MRGAPDHRFLRGKGDRMKGSAVLLLATFVAAASAEVYFKETFDGEPWRRAPRSGRRCALSLCRRCCCA